MNPPDIYLGNDLIENSRILASINKIGQRFLDRIYTRLEQEYCQSKAIPHIHYAGRFAAKEAVMKALYSSGNKNPISFKSIEIKPGENGEPIVSVNFLCNGRFRLSISHTNEYAIASAIFITE